MRLLVDGDMLVYRMAAACQEVNPWDKTMILKADPEETWGLIELRLQQCINIAFDHFQEDIEPIICFSSKVNFRKEVNPTYKANRANMVKPVLYQDMVDKTMRNYTSELWEGLEADDILGILSEEGQTIICTGDKDLRQIAGYHINLIDPNAGVYQVGHSEANLMFRSQCLSGDAVDGYSGCPGIGAVKARKIVEDAGANWWNAVVDTYINAKTPKTIRVNENGKIRIKKVKPVSYGLTSKDALVTARCAYILRHEDEYKDGVVKLWEPNKRLS